MYTATGKRVDTEQIAHTFPKVSIEFHKSKHDYEESAHHACQ